MMSKRDKKRSPGWTWVMAVLEDPWSPNFKKARYPVRTLKELVKYLRVGDFTDSQKRSWLPEVRRIYETKCRARGVEPCEFPRKLQKQIDKLNGIK